MKKNILKIFYFLIFIYSLIFFYQNKLNNFFFVFSQTNNLVINGDFEQGRTGWGFEGQIERQEVESPGYNSQKALHIKNFNQNIKSRVIQWVKIENDAFYNLSLVIKKINRSTHYPQISADEWCLHKTDNKKNQFIKGKKFDQLTFDWSENKWLFRAGNCDLNQYNHMLAIYFDTGGRHNDIYAKIGEIWVDNVFLTRCLKTLGDANCDGIINDNDYNIWRCEFLGSGSCNTPPSERSADFNLSTRVDIIDFEIWRTNSLLNQPTNRSQPTNPPQPTDPPKRPKPIIDPPKEPIDPKPKPPPMDKKPINPIRPPPRHIPI